MSDEPITEEWLKEVGFRWHQLDRQPDKHWLLWLGNAVDGPSAMEDIGVEVTPNRDGKWFCWFRSDAAHRYGRFVHVRFVTVRGDLIRLVEAITGQEWFPGNHFWGSVLTPQNATRERLAQDRLDRRMLEQHHKWREIEKDDTRGGALPEHMEKAEFGKDH